MNIENKLLVDYGFIKLEEWSVIHNNIVILICNIGVGNLCERWHLVIVSFSADALLYQKQANATKQFDLYLLLDVKIPVIDMYDPDWELDEV